MNDDLAARLRQQGLRLTPQRELILRAVEELRHATPDEVLAHVRSQVSSVNASTVYRTLEVLEELGLVRHAHLGHGAPTYHAADDEQHLHLVCRFCGGITETEVALAAPLVEMLRDQHGFTTDVSHFAIYGTCKGCAPA